MVDWHGVWSEECTRWSLFAAVGFGVTAAVFAVPFTRLATSVTKGRFFIVAAVLSAGIVGGTGWWVVEHYGDGHFVVGGVVVGAVTGVLSHVLTWVLLPVLTPGIPVGAALVLPLASLGSLLLVGWITLPLGVVGGIIVAVIRLEDPDLFAGS
jgi:hypothetical protein